MTLKIIYSFLLLFVFAVSPLTKNKYYKDFYESGKPKSEGWIKNGLKTGYWKFYHKNGAISEQGHFKYNVREKYWYFYSPSKLRIKEGNFRKGKMYRWWLFYDSKGRIDHKCQLSAGRKNGYCLKYENDALISAEKYRNGKKIKEWFSYNDFQRENKLSDLK